jgi:hypothetical protein
MFGDSGFGVSTNYTYVHSGLRYDNARSASSSRWSACRTRTT